MCFFNSLKIPDNLSPSDLTSLSCGARAVTGANLKFIYELLLGIKYQRCGAGAVIFVKKRLRVS